MSLYTKPLPKYGDLLTINEFQEDVESGSFIDYDGQGDLVKDGMLSDIVIYPSTMDLTLLEHPEATHVMWYNR